MEVRGRARSQRVYPPPRATRSRKSKEAAKETRRFGRNAVSRARILYIPWYLCHGDVCPATFLNNIVLGIYAIRGLTFR